MKSDNLAVPLLEIKNLKLDFLFEGRDSALRCPRRVQRRNLGDGLDCSARWNAGGDAAARRPYHL